MISLNPAALAGGALENIGVACARSNEDKEFRARRETIDGKPAIVLFSRPLRPLRNGLFQAFWNWLYIDAERELARAAIIDVLTKSADDGTAAQEFRQQFKDKKILEVVETGKILYAHHPRLMNAALEMHKTGEQRKTLADSLTLAKSLEHHPGCRIGLQSQGDVEKKFAYFFQYADRLLTGQNLPPPNTRWDSGLLLEFAQEWKASAAGNRTPDLYPYPTAAIIDAACELANLIIEKFGPHVAKPGAKPLYISQEEFQEKLGRDDRVWFAMQGLYERMHAGKPVFDETSMQLLNMLVMLDASASSWEECVKNFELFVKLFCAGTEGLGLVDFDLLPEFAKRWDYFSERHHHLTVVVAAEVRSAMECVLAHLRTVCIAR